MLDGSLILIAVNIREQMGVRDTLIRLAVGIEGTDDLIADMKEALEEI